MKTYNEILPSLPSASSDSASYVSVRDVIGRPSDCDEDGFGIYVAERSESGEMFEYVLWNHSTAWLADETLDEMLSSADASEIDRYVDFNSLMFSDIDYAESR